MDTQRHTLTSICHTELLNVFTTTWNAHSSGQLLLTCHPGKNPLLTEREDVSKHKVQSISDQKYRTYRKMKSLCPILSPTASPAQTPTSPLSYLPCMPCFKTRSWSSAKQNWVLSEVREATTSRTTSTTVLAAPCAQQPSPADSTRLHSCNLPCITSGLWMLSEGYSDSLESISICHTQQARANA